MTPFPNKKYQIIYADPPWLERGGGKIKRGADKHYSLMKTKDIMSLPVKNLADDNCHLYLWVTNNFLPDGLSVMSAWGFQYKTIITWVKDRIGLGQYFREQSEHCLFGVRGMIPYKIIDGKRQQGTTVFHAPKRKHSEKPHVMRDIIEKVSDRDGFHKIELFAREKIDGWDAWGSEIIIQKDARGNHDSPCPVSIVDGTAFFIANPTRTCRISITDPCGNLSNKKIAETVR